MAILMNGLPDWSKTVNPNYRSDYSQLKIIVLQFLALSPDQRKAEIEAYSSSCCFPEVNLSKASGVYLLLRLAFDLPSRYPRSKTRVFGSWLHPSIGEDSSFFDLTWPVRVDPTKQVIIIESFHGYAGRPYDVVNEYKYFAKHFHLRKQDIINKYSIQ